MAETKKYVLKRAIHGGDGKAVGTVIDLTEAQAAHPFFRNRVDAVLVVAEEVEEDDKASKSQQRGAMRAP